MEAMNEARKKGIFMTVLVRLREGKKGPPDGYSDAEKKAYSEYEETVLKDRAEGKVVNYSFPNSYD